MTADELRVLLIEDDEDDYLLTREYLSEGAYAHYTLDWVQTYEQGLAQVLRQAHDIYLVDWRLGARDGLELLREAVALGCDKPLIFLTGTGDREIDMQAMELGASDFLVKGQYIPQMLERSIRYAVRHAQVLRSLRLSEARYRAVLEAQTELVCRYLPDTTFTFVNGAFLRYFGAEATQIIGTRWLDGIQDADRPAMQRRIDRALSSRRAMVDEYPVMHEGALRWHQWTDQAIVDETDTVVEIQSVGIDITERKQAELALSNALKRERELGELKSRFVSMTSHEFRSPLTTILSTASYLQMADAELTAEKRMSRLAKIENATHDMVSLLEEVLLFGKADAGKLDYHPLQFDIIAFVSEIIEDIRAGAGRFHTIRLRIPDMPVLIHADEKLVRMVVTNLVTNAVKYSKPGTVVQISIDAMQDGGVRLAVSDQGIGIPLADQRHMFEPFHRARNTREIAGTGLGLAIARRAVEQHGGEIGFESVQNQGTVFTVTFPRGQ